MWCHRPPVLGREGRPGAWPASKDSQTCGCGVRDGRACGVQTRMARHGMRNGRACGLQTKAPGVWVWHKGWAGVWPGLQTKTTGHQSLAWRMSVSRWSRAEHTPDHVTEPESACSAQSTIGESSVYTQCFVLLTNPLPHTGSRYGMRSGK